MKFEPFASRITGRRFAREMSQPRAVSEIAQAIYNNWQARWADAPQRPAFIFHAWPYLEAMLSLTTSSAKEFYGLEDAQMIVLRFLDNATFWRGPAAAQFKQELKARLQYDNPTKGR